MGIRELGISQRRWLSSDVIEIWAGLSYFTVAGILSATGILTGPFFILNYSGLPNLRPINRRLLFQSLVFCSLLCEIENTRDSFKIEKADRSFFFFQFDVKGCFAENLKILCSSR